MGIMGDREFKKKEVWVFIKVYGSGSEKRKEVVRNLGSFSPNYEQLNLQNEPNFN